MPSTARIDFRRIGLEDGGTIAELNADPDVMRFLGNGRPMSREQVLSGELPRLMMYNSRGDGLGYWLAIERATGMVLGWFAITPDENRTSVAEVGYRLRPCAWGKGYATEGALCMLDIARTVGSITTVCASTMAVNTRSRRVLERIGLVHIRTWFGDWAEPIAGSEHGDVDYEIHFASA